MRKRDTRARASFTLIELLVVVAIIMLLAALLLPALKRARESAKRVACVSQIKQISTMLLMYSVDNHDCLPPSYDDEPIPYQQTWGSFLCAAGYVTSNATLMTLRPTDRTLLCPASTVTWSGYTDWRRGHYGQNDFIAGVYNDSFIPHYPLTAVVNPSAKIHLLDGGGFHMEWNYTGAPGSPGPVLPFYYVPSLAVNASYPWTADCAGDAVQGRHGQSINIAYLDGHVQSVDARVTTDLNLWLATSP